MITKEFLLGLRFKKIELLELTVLNSSEQEITFKSEAYVLKCDPDLWLTVFLRPEGNLAVLGKHSGPLEEREAITFDNPETIIDVMKDYFGLRISWVDFFYNQKTEEEINSCNLFDTKGITKDGWQGFTRSMAFGYWLSIDLLKDKFKDDFDFDKTFDKISGLSLRKSLCQMLLTNAKMEPKQVVEIMTWLESPKVSKVIEEEKEFLKSIVKVVEGSVLLPDDQILPFWEYNNCY